MPNTCGAVRAGGVPVGVATGSAESAEDVDPLPGEVDAERTRCVSMLRTWIYHFNLQLKQGSWSKAAREKIRALWKGTWQERELDEFLDRIEELEECIRGLQKEIEG